MNSTLFVLSLLAQGPAPAAGPLESSRRNDLEESQFGYSLANLGDLDGDGEEEIAIGAPLTDNRSGAILIISIPSGRLVRAIAGSRASGLFGSSLRCLPLGTASSVLAVGGDESWDQGYSRRRTWIVDPRTGALVFELAGTTEVQGWQPDVDGDGVREIVATTMRSSGLRIEYLSGASGRPIAGKAFDPDLILTGLDFDGDELFDFVREPRGLDRELELVSGATGESMRRLSVGIPLKPMPWDFEMISSDVDGDRRGDLVFTWSESEQGWSQVLAAFGPKLEQRSRFSRKHSRTGLESFGYRCERQRLFPCGDVNGDAREDLLISVDSFWNHGLTGRSGAEGKVIWQGSDLPKFKRTSIDRTKDLDGDGVPDLVCGWVSGSTDEFDGRVELLSGKHGSVLKTFAPLDFDPSKWVRPKSADEPALKPARSKRVHLGAEIYPDCTLFGLAVVNLGDSDGDGEEELAVGAPGAWTDAGRTGAVLILGARRGRMLGMIAGEKHRGFFGDRLVGVMPLAGTQGRLLGVENGKRRQVFDPRSGKLVREGAVGELESPLLLDVDGDGVLDRLRRTTTGDREVVFIAASDSRELLRLPTESPARFDRGWPSALAADFDADGRRDLAMVWPDFDAGTSRLALFVGPDLKQRLAITLVKDVNANLNADRLLPTLVACGDVNGDHCEDVLVATTAFPNESLDCRSGVDGALLWSTANAVVDTRIAIERIQDLDGDGVNEILSGKVLYLPYTPQYDQGEVLILSGKTGRVVSVFRERDYSQISLERYRVEHGD